LKKLFPLVKEHEDILRKLYYAEHTLEACWSLFGNVP
jgi:hypothetical protein